MRQLAGKTAFVTGGASGIGLALGRAFAQAGMKVMLADVESDGAGGRRREPAPVGADVRGVDCDVADPSASSARQGVVRGVRKRPCRLQQCRRRRRRRHRPHLGRQLALGDRRQPDGRSVRHPAFLPHIRAHGEGGHIVNTASMAGLHERARVEPLTAASKFAVVGMSEGLAMQLKPFGIGRQRALSRASCAPGSAKAAATGRSATVRRIRSTGKPGGGARRRASRRNWLDPGSTLPPSRRVPGGHPGG